MGDRIGIARFDSGRGNTMRIVFPEVRKPKKYIIKFETTGDDFKEGIFGFDKIIDDYDSICTSNKADLENEYNPITVEGKKYFPPWVSMRKGQTITLKLTKDFRHDKEYQSIAIEEHPDFTFEPTDLRDASEIKITCKNTNESTAQVKVKADENDAGAINFFYPKPKTVDLEWCFVEISGNEEDFDRL